MLDLLIAVWLVALAIGLPVFLVAFLVAFRERHKAAEIMLRWARERQR